VPREKAALGSRMIECFHGILLLVCGLVGLFNLGVVMQIQKCTILEKKQKIRCVL